MPLTPPGPIPPEVDRAAGARAALAARRSRAELKRRIRDGELGALQAAEAGWTAEDPKSAEASLRVRELLLALPGVGPVRADAALAELGISPSKRIGGLGVRQRRRLRDWLVARLGAGPGAHGRLVVLAGPTAVGKGTVSSFIRDNYPEVLFSVSATTRPARPGEVDGVHYWFIDDPEFDRMVTAGEFLEYATVHNAYRYGTPRPPVERALAEGRSVLLEIDLQGARSVRRAMPEALLVFLLPPSWEELVRRLVGRGTESPEEQERRLVTARAELAAQDEFDVRIVNRDVSQAAHEVVELLAVPAAHR